MNELKSLLIGVPNSYYDFVEGMLQIASKSDYAKNELIEFIKSNPTASSGEVILFATRKFELYSAKTEQTA